MECYRHPEVVSAATCVACARPICEECREEIAGHAICQPCVVAAQARLSAESAAVALGASSVGRLSEDAASSVGSGAVAEPITLLDSGLESPAAGPKEFIRAGIVRRLVRGLVWGAIYGQWWTLFTIVSPFLWGHGSFDLAATVGYMVVYGFFGSLTGLIIGACNASMGTGVGMGIGAGLLLCALEVLLSHDPGALINLIFYFFTGRFVGAGIVWRVQQPIRRKGAREGG